jgi:thiamine pyrophosphate-dependent acetolactate synthase large subunit-like protein
MQHTGARVGREHDPGERSTRSPLELPILSASAGEARFGSDAVADALRAANVPYIALNPGASFRGLHDSLVNYLGNQRPTMLLCLHEEHAVAIAHGYAKVTGRAMAAAVHSNVGLFHATMAIFNAWCDRMPVVVIGATGPVDAVKRRPWIDWIHTARDQGAIVRPYVKWDDQPASPVAARETILRAAWISQAAPQGPVYVNLDAAMQEEALEKALPPLDAERLSPRVSVEPSQEMVDRAVGLLRSARRPMILIGRVSRDPDAWHDRILLAEALGARVITDLKVGAAFPTDHPLHVASPGLYLLPKAAEAIRDADVILSLDWVDLAGTLKAALGSAAAPTIIQVTLDHVLHNGWSMDHQALPPVDLFVACEPDAAVAAMVATVGQRMTSGAPDPEVPAAPEPLLGGLSVDHLGRVLRFATREREVSLLHLPLSWNGAVWPFRHPLEFLGGDGGAGIGAGPGVSVGAALALRDTGSRRLPVAVCGDGDFLMGATAVWTAVHYRIPLLIVVANNRSFYNDEVHQERMARLRDRPVENKWIGQRLIDPEIDLAGLARAQGAKAFGPVKNAPDLLATLDDAILAVEDGSVAVVDVWVEPGYTSAMTAALTEPR